MVLFFVEAVILLDGNDTWVFLPFLTASYLNRVDLLPIEVNFLKDEDGLYLPLPRFICRLPGTALLKFD